VRLVVDIIPHLLVDWGDHAGRRCSSLEDFSLARLGKGSTASRDPSLAVGAL
jgi:hypothetical protein